MSRGQFAECKYRNAYEKENFTNINVLQLRDFLIAQKDEWFNSQNAAVSQSDMEYFNIKTDREHLVMYGEIMMVDIYAGQMWICEHTRKAYRNKIRGRSLQLRPLAMVIDDCHNHLGSTWNGYWLIPNKNVMSKPKGQGE